MGKSNIVLIGMPGSGKSSVGRILAEHMEMLFFDTDTETEKHIGTSIRKAIETQGEAYFRNAENDTLCEVATLANSVISTGGGSVLSPCFDDLRKNGCIVFLNVGVAEIQKRLTSDKKVRPLLSRPTENSVRELYDFRLPFYMKYADITIDGDYTAEETAEMVLSALAVV